MPSVLLLLALDIDVRTFLVCTIMEYMRTQIGFSLYFPLKKVEDWIPCNNQVTDLAAWFVIHPAHKQGQHYLIAQSGATALQNYYTFPNS